MRSPLATFSIRSRDGFSTVPRSRAAYLRVLSPLKIAASSWRRRFPLFPPRRDRRAVSSDRSSSRRRHSTSSGRVISLRSRVHHAGAAPENRHRRFRSWVSALRYIQYEQSVTNYPE